MSNKNKNLEPSPFHKKGKNEGDHKKNAWGRIFDSSRYGDDEWGIDQGQKDVKKAFGEFGNVDTEANLFAGAKNLVNIRDNYENTMEDLTVNQQQFQLQKQMSQQGAANAMDTFRGAAGGSGAAGLAQAMANQQAQSAQQISASVGQQESANQMASAQQAASIQQQQRQNDAAVSQGAMEAQKFQLQGAADARDLTLQQKQGQLSFLAGQQQAYESNKDADTAGKSDRRLKKNITKIGESNRGFNVYSFEYKDSLDGEGLFQGVMSDEIPQEAVTSVDGYDRVNYSMLDVEFKQI
tara:strand:- start:701 stop:1585 length:885 start_codon:yes stop_codon:yes gene_type:complete